MNSTQIGLEHAQKILEYYFKINDLLETYKPQYEFVKTNFAITFDVLDSPRFALDEIVSVEGHTEYIGLTNMLPVDMLKHDLVRQMMEATFASVARAVVDETRTEDDIISEMENGLDMERLIDQPYKAQVAYYVEYLFEYIQKQVNRFGL